MNVALSPKESGEFIAKAAQNVTVLESGIKELSKKIAEHVQNGTLGVEIFSQYELYPSVANEEAINWIFLIDTLNFCFWSTQNKKWCVTWNGKSYTGFFALCAAINRALDEGCPITDPKYYSRVSLEDLRNILRGDNGIEIPLLKEREKCLHEVGLVLLEKYDGSFENCIKESNKSAEQLLKIIVNNFSCYRDEGIYNEVKVSFHKRAQILIGDIWACFKGKGIASFKDIAKLTMFADYRIPQVLIHFKTLKYSERLMDILNKDEILQNGSMEEMEIRGCSIHVVQLISDEVKKILPGVKDFVDEENEANSLICNPVLIDHFLWNYRRENAESLEKIPFHKTLSIFY